MGSFLCLALLLLRDPLSDLPQPLNREQRGGGGREIGVRCSAVVSQARGNGSVIAIGHANDEVGVWPSAYSNEPDLLTM